MILGESTDKPTGIGGRATLDDLFRRAVARRPDAIALIDPPDRPRITGDPPRSLDYAQADQVISAIAAEFRKTGLGTDAIIGLQLGNTVEFVLAFLAVLRAGMIAVPLPLLWRRAAMVDALGRVGASALVVSGRIGSYDQSDDVLQTAAETFHLRFVFGFGETLPDGVIGLGHLFDLDGVAPARDFETRPHPPGPAAHVAVVTWDLGSDGPVPVARSHAELAAGGLTVLLESRLRQDATLLSTMTMTSFAGLASTLLPWLLVGGTLALHHPFDPAVFLEQQQTVAPDVVVAPGPLLAPLIDAGALLAGPGLASVIAIWSAPERLARATAWGDAETDLVDVQAFGEVGVIAAQRGADGRPAVVPFGPLAVPRGGKGGVIVGEIRPTSGGTVAMRGPMVPRAAFPPGVERTSLPQMKIGAGGFVDTGFACWSDQANGPLTVTAPPPGTIAVGGYRFLMRDLEDLIAAIDGTATLAALPDGTTGHRLAGSASQTARLRSDLQRRGLTPLLADAFRGRPPAADDDAA